MNVRISQVHFLAAIGWVVKVASDYALADNPLQSFTEGFAMGFIISCYTFILLHGYATRQATTPKEDNVQ